MVPDAITAASGGSLLFDQYRPFANLKPKNRKNKKPEGIFNQPPAKALSSTGSCVTSQQ
jgi:hypothetical protein